MLQGAIWEVLIPATAAVVAGVMWVAQPQLRGNRVLRLILMISIAWTTLELMLGVLIYGVFLVTGGMENF